MARNVSYPCGAVVFRQGEEPGSCFVILAGEVDVYVAEGPGIGNRRLSGVAQDGAPEEPLPESAQPPGAPPSPLADGLGKLVATLGPGQLFGELREPRTTSVCCRSDCDFLVIHSCDAERVHKESAKRSRKEQIDFLREHVPGMTAVPARRAGSRPHAGMNFRKGSFGKGHVFLRQGSLAEDCIYVVYSGSVEVLFQPPQAQRKVASPCAASRASSASTTCSGASRSSLRHSLTGLAGSRRPSDAGPSAGQEVRRLGVLQAGGVFGALTKDREAEAYTVVSTTPCEVFSATGEQVARLPTWLVENVREYLARTGRWHAERLRSLMPVPAPLAKQPGITAYRRCLSMPSLAGLTASLPAPERRSSVVQCMQRRANLGRRGRLGSGAPGATAVAPAAGFEGRRSGTAGAPAAGLDARRSAPAALDLSIGTLRASELRKASDCRGSALSEKGLGRRFSASALLDDQGPERLFAERWVL